MSSRAAQIFSFMHPRDILNLARTTKDFRAEPVPLYTIRYLAHHTLRRCTRLRLCRARRAGIGTLLALMNEPKPRPCHL